MVERWRGRRGGEGGEKKGEEGEERGVSDAALRCWNRLERTGGGMKPVLRALILFFSFVFGSEANGVGQGANGREKERARKGKAHRIVG